jgi:hypothetical protein
MNLTSSAQRCAAVLLFVAGGTHIPLIQGHLQEAPYVGWLFIGLSVACLVLGTVILFVDGQGVWAIGGATCLAAVVAFLASRTVGLPQIGDDVGNWTDPLALPAVASEALMVVLAHLRLRRLRPCAISPTSAYARSIVASDSGSMAPQECHHDLRTAPDT